MALIVSVKGFTAPKTFDKTTLHHSNTPQYKSYALFSVAPTSESFSQGQEDAVDDIEDLYLVDNANCTSQFLRGLWQLIARGNNMVRGVSRSMLRFTGCLRCLSNAPFVLR